MEHGKKLLADLGSCVEDDPKVTPNQILDFYVSLANKHRFDLPEGDILALDVASISENLTISQFQEAAKKIWQEWKSYWSKAPAFADFEKAAPARAGGLDHYRKSIEFYLKRGDHIN